MREDEFYTDEYLQYPEHEQLPENSALPEYNPVYPDTAFFKESYVTTREENIFQGHPPEGEPDLQERREKNKKRQRYSILQKFLGSAVQGGAAVLATAAVVVVLCSGGHAAMGRFVRLIDDAVSSARRPAFTRQIGYAPEDFVSLWNGDPNAPHKYDLENPVITKVPTCTEDGEQEFICTECGVHMHAGIIAGGHQPGEPVKEDEITATCSSEGSYTLIVNCTVCGEELSREHVVVEKVPHTPGDPQISEETAPTCTLEGSHREIVVCTVCGEQLSDEIVVSAALGHTPADPVKENEIPPKCLEPGSYEEVITCSVCGEEISRTPVTTEATGHTPADAVRENDTPATCTAAGHYDSVVYCSVCGEKLSVRAVNEPAQGHKAAAAVKENETAATCTAAGRYDNVVYCSVCGEKLSASTVTVPATGHTAGSPKKENERVDNCLQGGSYEEVVKCTTCGTELSRRTVAISPTDHTAGNTVRNWIYGHENDNGTITGPDCLDGGSYQDITYCSVCGAEMMVSEETFVDPPGHSFNTSPHSQRVRCSVCGTEALTAEYNVTDNGGYVYYYLDDEFLAAMSAAGKTKSDVMLIGISYYDEEVYDEGSYGEIFLRNPPSGGESMYVEITFSDGSSVISNTFN